MELNAVQIANRVQWVHDLLSGDFKQGRRALKRRDEDGNVTYCCLGVVCERIAPRSNRLKVDDFGVSETYMAESTASNLLGLGIDDQSRAAWWNDTNEYDFARIADFIAYSTQHLLFLVDIDTDDIPQRFAVEWLNG